MLKVYHIARREFLQRVQTPMFVLMTLLGPLFLISALLGPLWLEKVTSSDQLKTIWLLDDTHTYKPWEDKDMRVIEVKMPLSQALAQLKNSDATGMLYVKQHVNNRLEASFYGFSHQKELMSLLTAELRIQHQKTVLKSWNLDPGKIQLLTITPHVTFITLPKNNSSEMVSIVGILAAMLMYTLVLIYGVQVMRGVTEEKTNRIVEVIFTSVKPIEFMIGKIAGIAGVGLLQCVLWGILFLVIGNSFVPEGEFLFAFQVINPLLIVCFGIYFLGGYLLYSALFAAVGATSDGVNDTQPLLLPITIPLSFTFLVSQYLLQNPNSALAYGLSIFPFTSPVAMMLLLPAGVSASHCIFSIVVLVSTLILIFWLAAKIYKAGILLHGQKITWKHIVYWLKT